MYTKSAFIFRRDLRLSDNTGLLEALKQSEKVIACFIFDKRQVGSGNDYKSSHAIQFMIESLKDLGSQLKAKNGKLYLFYGQAETVINKLIKDENIEAVFTNRDYTPFSINRDKKINAACKKLKCDFNQFDDLLLTTPEDIKTKSGTPYAVFSAFYKSARAKTVDNPKRLPKGSFYNKSIKSSEPDSIYKKILPKTNPKLHVNGGTKKAKSILKGLSKFKKYSQTRNNPSLPTTNLSAHNKFGTISIREVYHAATKALGFKSNLIQELYWRDFFTHVAYHNPHIFKGAYNKKYNSVKWSHSKKNFQAWCDGLTGFPIVDAGMRQLNTTGFMHNRVRMIVASFLTKDLHIDWRWGEKYFAQKLVDYDPCVNNGNWQWASSTGCDAQPYFRVFNPWLQQKKFDPECKYIKKWVPELKGAKSNVIHSLFKETIEPIKNYPSPIIDHSVESKLAKEMYKKALKS